jgi:hypothetical protein
MYVEFCARQFATSGSVHNCISSVKYYFNIHNYPLKLFNSFKLRMLVKSISRTLPKRKSTRHTVTDKQFRTMIKNARCYNKDKHAVRLALSMGYFGFLRSSNIVPMSKSSFNRKEHTTLQDISIQDHHVSVCIKWTKTRQQHDPIHVALPVIKDPSLDPVTHFKNMIKVQASSPPLNGPAIRYANGSIMTAGKLNKHLAPLAKSVPSVKHSNITSHSMRRSSTTACALHGATEPQLLKQGTWSSAQYLSYIINDQLLSCPVQSSFDAMYN